MYLTDLHSPLLSQWKKTIANANKPRAHICGYADLMQACKHLINQIIQ